MKKETSAGVIIYSLQPCKTIIYLLLHYAHGHWDFPKGRIEENENLQQTALRELKEETGLSAQLHTDFLYSFDYFVRDEKHKPVLKTVSFFIGPASHHEVHLSHEHIDFIWLPFKQALGRLTYDNAKEALTVANQFLLQQDLPWPEFEEE